LSWLYLLYKCSENAGLCVFCALLAQKLLTEQTELNRELCTALHCSTRFFVLNLWSEFQQLKSQSHLVCVR